MTEKREWWSDDLIAAVSDAMESSAYHDEMVYAVIAAVEDWQDKQIIGCRYACIGGQGMELAKRDLVIQRVKDYCERRREDRGGDLTALDVLRLLHGSPVVGDLSSQADDGQRLDVNALLSERMEQVERAKRAEAEVERLNRIISESKPWIAMADELADAQATIQRVRELIDKSDAAQCGAEVTAMTVTTDQVRSALDGAMMSSDLSHVPPKRTRVDPAAEWRERAKRAEDTIQRVRHVVLANTITGHDLTDFYKGYNKALSDVFSAMNGWGREECPTCSWPVRETVGLVCQTCGTDYGRALDGGTDD